MNIPELIARFPDIHTVMLSVAARYLNECKDVSALVDLSDAYSHIASSRAGAGIACEAKQYRDLAIVVADAGCKMLARERAATCGLVVAARPFNSSIGFFWERSTCPTNQ